MANSKCTKCQATIPSSDFARKPLFCIYCGSPLETEHMQKMRIKKEEIEAAAASTPSAIRATLKRKRPSLTRGQEMLALSKNIGSKHSKGKKSAKVEYRVSNVSKGSCLEISSDEFEEDFSPNKDTTEKYKGKKTESQLTEGARQSLCELREALKTRKTHGKKITKKQESHTVIHLRVVDRLLKRVGCIFSIGGKSVGYIPIRVTNESTGMDWGMQLAEHFSPTVDVVIMRTDDIGVMLPIGNMTLNELRRQYALAHSGPTRWPLFAKIVGLNKADILKRYVGRHEERDTRKEEVCTDSGCVSELIGDDGGEEELINEDEVIIQDGENQQNEGADHDDEQPGPSGINAAEPQDSEEELPEYLATSNGKIHVKSRYQTDMEQAIEESVAMEVEAELKKKKLRQSMSQDRYSSSASHHGNLQLLIKKEILLMHGEELEVTEAWLLPNESLRLLFDVACCDFKPDKLPARFLFECMAACNDDGCPHMYRLGDSQEVADLPPMLKISLMDDGDVSITNLEEVYFKN